MSSDAFPAPNEPATPVADAGHDPALMTLVERIVADLEPVGVWLFGSRAERRARPDSDYDLLVVLPDEAPPSAFDPVRLWRIGRAARLPADIVACTTTEFEEEKLELDTLPRAAWLRGHRLYER